VRGIFERSKCISCNKGFWSNTSGAFEMRTCLPCELGRYQNRTGATTENIDCVQCPLGRASNTPAAETIDNCIACPPGKFMDAETTGALCSSCPKGYAQPLLAAFSCDICAIAKFAGTLGSARCQNCK